MSTLTGALGIQLSATAERALAITANNLVNSQTIGFQTENSFLVTLNSKGGEQGPVGFVFEKGMIRNTDPGRLMPTSNPLDFAIQGSGYFAIQTPKGIRYTRNGSFTLDATGQIVTPNGYPLLDGSNSPITVPVGASITMTPDGVISTEQGILASLGVKVFKKPEEMIKEGNNLFSTSEAPLPPDEEVNIIQGSLESSNVSPTKEMAKMVEIERTYQMAQKLIQQDHDLNMDAIKTFAAAA